MNHDANSIKNSILGLQKGQEVREVLPLAISEPCKPNALGVTPGLVTRDTQRERRSALQSLHLTIVILGKVSAGR